MRRMIPSLQALLCFESAAKHLSYTHAAQELFLTQSAVSRQIKQLEQQLGLDLFQRSRYGVELTAAGEHYYNNIKTLLSGLEQSTQDLMTHKGLGGTLRLGVVPTFATRWLLPRLHQFNNLHPEITIHLTTSTKPFLFSENLLDAAIYTGTAQQIQHWPGIKSQLLMPEDLVAVCSPQLIRKYLPEIQSSLPSGQLQLSAEQMAKLPLLQQTTRPHIWQEWFNLAGFHHPGALEGQRHELFSMLAVAATHHLGLALIPENLLQSELAAGDLIIASTQKLLGARAYYFVYSEQQPSPLIDKFSAWLLQQSQ